jgi:hypothetical protein
MLMLQCSMQVGSSTACVAYGLGCREPGLTTEIRFLDVCISCLAPEHQSSGILASKPDSTASGGLLLYLP